MKTPTRAELDAIPISDAEQVAHLRYRQRMLHALDKGHVPVNLEWSLVMLDAATQLLVLQGMPRDYFLLVGDTMFALSLDMLQAPPTPPKSFPPRGTTAGRVQRLFSALSAAGVDPAYPDTAAHLVGLAGDVLARNAVTAPMFNELCGAAFELAEARVVAMGKRNEA